MTLNQHNVINSGFRGLVCAGLATIITASLSWTFVVSSDSLEWMGRGAMDPPGMAVIVGERGTGGEMT
jgi:hypothetical protein